MRKLEKFKHFLVIALCSIISSCQNSGKIDFPISDLFLDTLPTDHESILRINTMKGDIKHGESYLYYPGYGDNRWDLFIKDTLLISLFCGLDNSHYGCTYVYFNKKDSTKSPIGSLMYDHLSDKRLDSISNYFEISARDTIYWGDPYWVKVSGILFGKSNFSISVRLGEITPSFELVNQNAFFESETQDVSFQIVDYRLGINLITGIVNYYRNGEDITQNYFYSEKKFPLVFYKQFVVLKPD